jgi:hypothetical protein
VAYYILQVDKMKKELIEKQPILDKASKDTAELMIVLEKDQAVRIIIT